MITPRTKVQLVVFVVLTLVGVSYVGARYAQIDRLVIDRTYTVVAHYPDSGGIFEGAEVTYRGVQIGRVGELELTDDGVDVHLDIENEFDQIPSDAKAVVANRSAVGEQFVEVQPLADGAPFLEDNSEIHETETPISTEKLLADVSRTVSSVDNKALRTTVTELGAAFGGAGEDLRTIMNTQSRFIETASDNFEVTTALIRDSNTVLKGQVASESGIREFAQGMLEFSNTMVDSDGDLRGVIDTGSFTANQLRTFLESNDVPLGQLIRRLATTNEVFVRRIPWINHVLTIYPYIVEASFTNTDVDPKSGRRWASFGLIINDTHPCEQGYDKAGEERPPTMQHGGDIPMDMDARCTASLPTNPRGIQHAPRRAPFGGGQPDLVAQLDRTTGEVTLHDPASLRPAGQPVPAGMGDSAWKWLYVQPLLNH